MTAGGTTELIEWTDMFATELAKRAAEIDQSGALPADIVDAVKSSGIFRLWLPREIGGLEAHPNDVLAMISTLAMADPSTGWLAAIGIASNTVAAYLDPSVAREMFSTGAEFTAGNLRRLGTLVRRGDGTLEVSGSWPFGSCVEHADWIICGVNSVDDAAGPDVAVIAREHLHAAEPWTAIGLRASGSGHFNLESAPVDPSRCYSARSRRPWAEGALWRIPIPNLLFLAIAGVVMGIGRRAANDLADRNAANIKAPDDQIFEQCAQAIALIRSSDSYLRSAVRRSLSADPSTPDFAVANCDVSLAIVNAGQSIASAVEKCYRTTGSAVFIPDDPIQRAWRDISTAIQHIAFNTRSYVRIGRELAKLRSL